MNVLLLYDLVLTHGMVMLNTMLKNTKFAFQSSEEFRTLLVEVLLPNEK